LDLSFFLKSKTATLLAIICVSDYKSGLQKITLTLPPFCPLNA